MSSYNSNLTGASVTISLGTLQSGDKLNFTNPGGISGSYNSGAGVLTLTGTATSAQYQAALQSVTFSTTSLNTSARSLSIVALDGSLSGNSATETVDVAIAAPIVTASGAINTYIYGSSAPAIVDSGLTLSSFDSYLSERDSDVFVRHIHVGGLFPLLEPKRHQRQLQQHQWRADVERLGHSESISSCLASVSFYSTSDTTTTRTIAIVAFDGPLTSNTITEHANFSFDTLATQTPHSFASGTDGATSEP